MTTRRTWGPRVVRLRVTIVAYVILALATTLAVKIGFDTRQGSCESANEWRAFMGSYLSDQVGPPINPSAIDGYHDLDDTTRGFVDAFAALAETDRENAQLYAAAYLDQYPQRNC
jgi:hypothetical protein